MVEESDESEFWFEVIKDTLLSKETSELERLLKEVNELIKITSKARNSMSN